MSRQLAHRRFTRRRLLTAALGRLDGVAREQEAGAFPGAGAQEMQQYRWPAFEGGMPAATTPAPIMRCSSSTRPWASRSFHRMSLANIRMSRHGPSLSSAACRWPQHDGRYGCCATAPSAAASRCQRPRACRSRCSGARSPARRARRSDRQRSPASSSRPKTTNPLGSRPAMQAGSWTAARQGQSREGRFSG